MVMRRNRLFRDVDIENGTDGAKGEVDADQGMDDNVKRRKTLLIDLQADDASVDEKDTEDIMGVPMVKDQGKEEVAINPSRPMQPHEDQGQVNQERKQALQMQGGETKTESTFEETMADVMSKFANASDAHSGTETRNHFTNLFEQLRRLKDHSAKAAREAEENAVRAQHEMRQAVMIAQEKEEAYQATCRKRIADVKELFNNLNSNLGKTLEDLRAARACLHQVKLPAESGKFGKQASSAPTSDVSPELVE